MVLSLCADKKLLSRTVYVPASLDVIINALARPPPLCGAPATLGLRLLDGTLAVRGQKAPLTDGLCPGQLRRDHQCLGPASPAMRPPGRVCPHSVFLFAASNNHTTKPAATNPAPM